MGTRITRETLNLRYDFTDTEKLEMGTKMASNNNELDDIDSEEAVFKSRIKERRAGLEQSIKHLSRSISRGFEFRNTPCALQYDSPQINEVTYVRMDTGEVAQTRAMTAEERQQELDLQPAEPE